MERFYNLKKRTHGNGLTEYRVYEKPCSVGSVPKKIPKNDVQNLDIPFEDDIVRSEKFLDGDGFSCPVTSSNVSILKSLKRTKDAVYDYSNAILWEWFCTFTFAESEVGDRTDFAIVSKKMTKWLNNMRSRYCTDMQYVLVPEKHKNGAWHFHGIFANCAELGFVPAKNKQEFYKGKKNKYYGQNLVRNGQQVYDIEKFKLGFADCTKVRDSYKVASYILKYITKDMILDTLNRRRYWNSKNLPKVKEEIFTLDMSTGFDRCVNEIFSELAKEKNLEVYCNTFQVDHDDFKNKICYIKYNKKL